MTKTDERPAQARVEGSATYPRASQAGGTDSAEAMAEVRAEVDAVAARLDEVDEKVSRQDEKVARLESAAKTTPGAVTDAPVIGDTKAPTVKAKL